MAKVGKMPVLSLTDNDSINFDHSLITQLIEYKCQSSDLITCGVFLWTLNRAYNNLQKYWL